MVEHGLLCQGSPVQGQSEWHETAKEPMAGKLRVSRRAPVRPAQCSGGVHPGAVGCCLGTGCSNGGTWVCGAVGEDVMQPTGPMTLAGAAPAIVARRVCGPWKLDSPALADTFAPGSTYHLLSAAQGQLWSSSSKHHVGKLENCRFNCVCV